MVFSRKTLVFNYLNNNINSVFTSASSYVWNATRGYWNNLSNSNNFLHIGVKSYIINNVYAVRGNFYSKYNTPSNSLHSNYIRVTYTDATFAQIGAYDGSSNHTLGQGIFKGDAGEEIQAQRNVINEIYTYTIDIAKTIDVIQHTGCHYTGFPSAERGTKDIKFAYGDSPNWSKELTSAERHFITKWKNKKRIA